MKVQHVEILVEETSMEAVLRTVLPKILGRVSFEVYPYPGKAELLRRLPNRLSGYAEWLPETWRILVLVDRDDEDCRKLKSSLDDMARASGLAGRPRHSGHSRRVVNRLAIEELEAWYFGDWQAVCRAYPRVPSTVPTKARFRNPDAIAGGTWEAFEQLLQQAGYFVGGFRKIEAASHIAPHMEPIRNLSSSFQTLYSTLHGWAEGAQ